MKIKTLLILSLTIVYIFSVNMTMAGKTSGFKCEPGFTNCMGKCVNLKSDSANCGTCGMSCPSGWTAPLIVDK
jgi:hypothetical protein